MVLADLREISAAYSGHTILETISLQIKSADKIGLIGRNGIGKTTIFRMLLGDHPVDRGEMSITKGVRIGYLPQEVKLDRGWTLYDEACSAFENLIAAQNRIEELQHKISDGDADRSELEELGKLQERFEHDGGFTYQSRIESVLQGLGFDDDEHQKPLNLFSGGERARAYLARLLLSEPDILLLDEPTNHLDIESTEWLEAYIRELPAAVIIVSHDRVFLNRTTTRTCELFLDRLDDYAGNFDFFTKERAARNELQSKAYERQQEEIARIEDFIQRNIAGQKTRQAQSRRKMLSKLKRLAPVEKTGRAASVKMESAGRSHLKILKVDGLAKSFHGRNIFRNVNMEIERGDKVGLIGPNGCGKSTFVRIVTGELESDGGNVTVGGNVVPAYFDQELSILNDGSTVLDSVWEEKPEAKASELRSYLGKYLFSGEDVFKKVSTLSGGEKSRLALAKILLLPANFLILDEPTNHLDIESCQQLEKAIKEFEGATLIISHDRYFLDNTVDKLYSFEGGQLGFYMGNFSYYSDKRREAAGYTEVESPEEIRKKEERISEWQDLKEKRRVRKQFEKLEQQIIDTEVAIDDIDRLLDDEDIQRDWERLHQLQADRVDLERRLKELFEEYERFEEENPSDS